jgi:hypothetical protein
MLVNESMIVCFSTQKYGLTTNFIDSLNDIGIPKKNINLCIDPTIIEPEFVQAHSEFWINVKIKKLQNLISKLKDNIDNKDYKYFISSDCDIWFIKENIAEWDNLQQYIDKSNKDIFFMSEGGSLDERGEYNINGGFYIIKNNRNLSQIIFFLDEIYNILVTTEVKDIPFADQQIINKYKYFINFGYIPNEYVIWGEIVYNSVKALIHHPVCCLTIQQKKQLIKSVKKRIVAITYNIVIAHNNENLGWIDYLDATKIIIYNKTDKSTKKTVITPHSGGGGALLHHIVNNYDNLPDYLFFLSGNPFEHINPQLADLHNLQGKIHETIFNSDVTVNSFFSFLVKEPIDLFRKGNLTSYFNFLFGNKCDSFIEYSPGFQYTISKKNILSRPKKFFEYINNMILNYQQIYYNQSCVYDNIFDKRYMSLWCLERIMWYIFNYESYNLSDEIQKLIS